jgi:hypothetical protein
MEYSKSDILWFSEKYWLEGLQCFENYYRGSFSKVISLEKDYVGLDDTSLNQIIQNLNKHLESLVHKTKNNNPTLSTYCFEQYHIKSLDVNVKYKRVGEQAHIPDVDNLIQQLNKVRMGENVFHFFQIEN